MCQPVTLEADEGTDDLAYSNPHLIIGGPHIRASSGRGTWRSLICAICGFSGYAAYQFAVDFWCHMSGSDPKMWVVEGGQGEQVNDPISNDLRMVHWTRCVVKSPREFLLQAQTLCEALESWDGMLIHGSLNLGKGFCRHRAIEAMRPPRHTAEPPMYVLWKSRTSLSQI